MKKSHYSGVPRSRATGTAFRANRSACWAWVVRSISVPLLRGKLIAGRKLPCITSSLCYCDCAKEEQALFLRSLEEKSSVCLFIFCPSGLRFTPHKHGVAGQGPSCAHLGWRQSILSQLHSQLRSQLLNEAAEDVQRL